jgi:hypothetical protein
VSDAIQLDPDFAADGQPLEPGIRVTAGNPDDAELAAVTAVLTAALEELAAKSGSRQDAGPSAWERSQRALRAPLHPENGAWRSFSV